jgi:hypothetical protein
LREAIEYYESPAFMQIKNTCETLMSTQRSFAVPMTEEMTVELIKVFESKLTASSFAKEQRNLMTKKLRSL